MDGTIVNVRLFSWHFQIARDSWWQATVSRNEYHKEARWPDGYCRVYRFFGYHGN